MSQVTATPVQLYPPVTPDSRATRSTEGVLMAAPRHPRRHLHHLPGGAGDLPEHAIASPIFPSRFVGLKNFRMCWALSLPSRPEHPHVRRVAVPLVIVLGVLTALLLNEPFVGNTVLRVGMLLPWALPASVAGILEVDLPR